MKSTSTGKTAQKVAALLFESGAITFRTSSPFKFTSGILSPVYSDNRLLISDVKKREEITDFFIERIKKLKKFDVIAAVATAGIPHASLVAHKLKLPLVYVRTSKKGHGLENQVEGRIKRRQTAVVIEDLVSTGQSSTQTVKALRKLGANADNLFAIFTYNLNAANENFKKNKINFQALCSLETAVGVAKENGYLKKEQVKTILEWANDPKNWAKKMGFA